MEFIIMEPILYRKDFLYKKNEKETGGKEEADEYRRLYKAWDICQGCAAGRKDPGDFH